MSKIVMVTAFDDYTLEIELGNRHKIIYDMKPRLSGVRFGTLTDLNKFKSVRVQDSDTLIWDGLCQITISEIISLVER